MPSCLALGRPTPHVGLPWMMADGWLPCHYEQSAVLLCGRVHLAPVPVGVAIHGGAAGYSVYTPGLPHQGRLGSEVPPNTLQRARAAEHTLGSQSAVVDMARATSGEGGCITCGLCMAWFWRLRVTRAGAQRWQMPAEQLMRQPQPGR
jgi:hypothetical protein